MNAAQVVNIVPLYILSHVTNATLIVPLKYTEFGDLVYE